MLSPEEKIKELRQEIAYNKEQFDQITSKSYQVGKFSYTYQELHDALCCPITCDVMTEPVHAEDGNTYERSAIKEWVERYHTSPITREPMTDNFTRNYKLEEVYKFYNDLLQNLANLEREDLEKEKEINQLRLKNMRTEKKLSETIAKEKQTNDENKQLSDNFEEMNFTLGQVRQEREALIKEMRGAQQELITLRAQYNPISFGDSEAENLINEAAREQIGNLSRAKFLFKETGKFLVMKLMSMSSTALIMAPAVIAAGSSIFLAAFQNPYVLGATITISLGIVVGFVVYGAYKASRNMDEKILKEGEESKQDPLECNPMLQKDAANTQHVNQYSAFKTYMKEQYSILYDGFIGAFYYVVKDLIPNLYLKLMKFQNALEGLHNSYPRKDLQFQREERNMIMSQKKTLKDLDAIESADEEIKQEHIYRSLQFIKRNGYIPHTENLPTSTFLSAECVDGCNTDLRTGSSKDRKLNISLLLLLSKVAVNCAESAINTDYELNPNIISHKFLDANVARRSREEHDTKSI